MRFLWPSVYNHIVIFQRFYYTCAAEIYFNPAWIIIVFYAIWVLFEVILARFFFMFLGHHQHRHPSSESVMHESRSVHAIPNENTHEHFHTQ